jgi:hypothetical protein
MSALDAALVRIMKDLKNHTVIWLKGALFLAVGVVSGALLLAEVLFLAANLNWSRLRYGQPADAFFTLSS